MWPDRDLTRHAGERLQAGAKGCPLSCPLRTPLRARPHADRRSCPHSCPLKSARWGGGVSPHGDTVFLDARPSCSSYRVTRPQSTGSACRPATLPALLPGAVLWTVGVRPALSRHEVRREIGIPQARGVVLKTLIAGEVRRNLVDPDAERRRRAAAVSEIQTCAD
jgi:hypothetical protein